MVHDYHVRQYTTMYESTRGLLDFMEECAGEMGERRIADVACGGGANLVHMLERWPQCRVTGYDLDEELLDYARAHLPEELAARCCHEPVDFYDLPERVDANTCAITTFMQTMMRFPADETDAVLRSLMHISSEWVFFNALVSDHRMDVVMDLWDYVKGAPDRICIFDADHFKERCLRQGAKEVIYKPFEIGIDLDPPPGGGAGTWTQRTHDGRRLQFSGAVHLPWHFCALRLS